MRGKYLLGVRLTKSKVHQTKDPLLTENTLCVRDRVWIWVIYRISSRVRIMVRISLL